MTVWMSVICHESDGDDDPKKADNLHNIRHTIERTTKQTKADASTLSITVSAAIVVLLSLTAADMHSLGQEPVVMLAFSAGSLVP